MAINNSVNLPASTDAQTKTGSSTSVAVTPSNLIHSQGEAKAWVRFAGATGTISDSYNVTSVTRVSAGTYTVNLSITMTNANYAVSCLGQGAGTFCAYGTTTTTTVPVTASQLLLGVITLFDPTSVTVTIFGQF